MKAISFFNLKPHTISCKVHGNVFWTGGVYSCKNCLKLFSLFQIFIMDYGDLCPNCNEILIPMYWRENPSGTLSSGCHLCFFETINKKGRIP